ncbi:MAG TPA: cytochrome c biogenesis protein CcsA [Gemmatimonadales bacterium]
MTPIDRAFRLARWGGVVTGAALLGVAGVYVRALVYTPVERFQGPAQKIFYIHVPSAWGALLGFAVTGVLSILYLWVKDRRIDIAAAASAEVGVALSVVLLTTGPIWGKPIWGTWWTWDARLTSTLFLFLLFVGYLVMRGVVVDPGLRSRFSAVIGVMGLVLIPFIHLTVYMFRTLHPAPIVLKPSKPSLPGEMLVTLLTSVAVFTVVYLGFLTQRYALGLIRDLREREAAGDA